MGYIDKEIAVRGLRMAHDYEAADFVAAIPATDVAPVRHGKWIKYTISDLFKATCSECHVDVEQRYPNCPYCRAIMDAD